jgi:hypothetical protein
MGLEMAKKAAYELLDLVQADPRYRRDVIEFTAQLKARRQQHTGGRSITTDMATAQLPAPVRRTSSKRKQMAADHTSGAKWKARKRSAASAKASSS